jgi:hypothetical protein
MMGKGSRGIAVSVRRWFRLCPCCRHIVNWDGVGKGRKAKRVIDVTRRLLPALRIQMA